MLSFSHSFFSLSCTLQGAGGVGGLLAVVRDDGGFAPTYDANGNASEYIQLSAVQTDNYPSLPIAGGIVAHYEYDAFGNTVAQSGNLADTFTHCFSTKPWCKITGVLHYQKRLFSPRLGCWLTRDPTEEYGGLNLYAFCVNDAVNSIDPVGLEFKVFGPKKGDFTRSGDYYTPGGVIPSPPAITVECKCSGGNYYALGDIYMTVSIYISPEESPAWKKKPETFPGETRPENWSDWKYKDRYDAVLEHEKKHVYFYRLFHDIVQSAFSMAAKRGFPTQVECDAYAQKLKDNIDERYKNLRRKQQNHDLWPVDLP